MNEEISFFVKYAPSYIPFLAAIILIIFTKKYLFRGMVSEDVHNAQIERERNLIKGTETISTKLQEIVESLKTLTNEVREDIRQNTDRLRSLEMAMSDYLDAFRELNHNFEKHRKGIPETQDFRQNNP